MPRPAAPLAHYAFFTIPATPEDTMTIEQFRQSRLACAYQWLEITAEPDADDETGIAFDLFVKVYIKHLLHQQGVKSFNDDLDWCQSIKDALRATEPVYAALAEFKQQNGSPESPETVSSATEALATFMSMSGLEIAATIRSIEESHPELAPYFASERKMFADWLAGEGPLAGTQWGI